MIKIKGLTKKYNNGDNDLYALNDVTIDIEEKQFVAITGKSGAGKSTFINMLGLIDRPDKGEIYVDDKNIFEFKKKEQLEYRRNKIGFVFQAFKLIPVLNVRDNIVIANENSKKYDEEYLKKITEKLEISDIMKKYPDQLSGGQKQRVAIARALINKPSILIADEPTGNLDSETSESVISLMKEVAKDNDMTLIMVTHDKEIAKKADKIINIIDGRIGE